MEIEESIVQLAARLDAWWDGFSPLLHSEDRVAQGKALLRGFELAKELDRLKADGLAAIMSLLNRQGGAAEDERLASLLQGFSFAAKLTATLHDKFRDTKGETEVVRLMYAIVEALDAVDPGRAALSALLDDRDPRVRAFAGAYLIKLIPERVIPILRDIEKKEHANSAHFTASWTLLRWEREGKQNSQAAPSEAKPTRVGGRV